MTSTILIFSGDEESGQFVEWLNTNGFEAELTNSEPDAVASHSDCGHNLNELWETYCNQPAGE